MRCCRKRESSLVAFGRTLRRDRIHSLLKPTDLQMLKRLKAWWRRQRVVRVPTEQPSLLPFNIDDFALLLSSADPADIQRLASGLGLPDLGAEPSRWLQR